MTAKELTCPKCQRKLPIIFDIQQWLGSEPDVKYGACLFNGLYGWDSGCEYIKLQARCECGWKHEHGTFGEYENEDEARDYLNDILAEWPEPTGT